MDDAKMIDRVDTNVLLYHNRDRFTPSIKCNSVLDGNVHHLDLNAEKICILYYGLV